MKASKSPESPRALTHHPKILRQRLMRSTRFHTPTDFFTRLHAPSTLFTRLYVLDLHQLTLALSDVITATSPADIIDHIC